MVASIVQPGGLRPDLSASGLSDAIGRITAVIEALQENFARLGATAQQAQIHIGAAAGQITSTLAAGGPNLLSESGKRAIKPIEDTLAGAATDIIMRTRSIGAALDSVVHPIVEDALRSTLRNLFNGLVFGSGAGLGNTTNDFSSAAGGAVFSGLFGAILSPFKLLGFARGGIVPSAAGGWSVPTLGPGGALAQVHSQEMVLPADISRGLRGVIANSGGHTFNIGISAMDAPSVQRLFMAHGSALVAALNRAMRNGSMLYQPS